MAFNAFLKIDGIPGESTDAKHKDEIDLVSFSWGEANAAGPVGGGGGGKVTFQDFHFTTHVNKSSPVLFFACASGQHIKSATLTCRQAGGRSPAAFLTFQMTDVLVSSYNDGGSSGDVIPLDSVSLNIAQIEIEYTPTNPTGTPGTPIKRGWNIKSNKKV